MTPGFKPFKMAIMMSMMIMRFMTMKKSTVKMMTKAFTISNDNRTMCSQIQGVIGQVISIWRYEITSPITPKLYDTRSHYRLSVSITKCENLSRGIFII